MSEVNNSASSGAYQQVFKNLHIAVVVRQVRCAVQRREAAIIALVDLRAVVEQVM